MFGIDKIDGLPLHVLVVHVAVVLIPLAVIALIATGWRKEWRRQYGLPVVLMAIGGAVAALIAAQTGETLESSVKDAARAAGARANFGDHPEQGELARNLSCVFAFAAAAFWSIEQWGERLKLKPWTSTAAYVLASGIGIVTVATVIIAGHSGSALVWKDLGNFVRR